MTDFVVICHLKGTQLRAGRCSLKDVSQCGSHFGNFGHGTITIRMSNSKKPEQLDFKTGCKQTSLAGWSKSLLGVWWLNQKHYLIFWLLGEKFNKLKTCWHIMIFFIWLSVLVNNCLIQKTWSSISIYLESNFHSPYSTWSSQLLCGESEPKQYKKQQPFINLWCWKDNKHS